MPEVSNSNGVNSNTIPAQTKPNFSAVSNSNGVNSNFTHTFRLNSPSSVSNSNGVNSNSGVLDIIKNCDVGFKLQRSKF